MACARSPLAQPAHWWFALAITGLSLVGAGAQEPTDTPDGFQTVDLGSGPATVTITSDGTSVSVAATGDATIVDETTVDAQWDELDQAIAACDPLLPAEFQNEPSDFPFGSDEALSTYAKG